MRSLPVNNLPLKVTLAKVAREIANSVLERILITSNRSNAQMTRLTERIENLEKTKDLKTSLASKEHLVAHPPTIAKVMRLRGQRHLITSLLALVMTCSIRRSRIVRGTLSVVPKMICGMSLILSLQRSKLLRSPI